MKSCNSIVKVVLLNALCAAAYCAALVHGHAVVLQRNELTRSVSPKGGWEFFMGAARDEDRGPTMWIARRHGRKATLIGELFRGGVLQWCPTDACLILVEEPSIEYMRIKVYRLDATGPQAFPALDRAIWDDVQGSIGKHSEILFSGLEVLGWLDERHVLIVAQARYVKRGTNAPALIFTSGYVVDIDSGKVSRRISPRALKTEYGFSEDIV